MTAFCGLVQMLVSLNVEEEGELCGIDWPAIRNAGRKLLQPGVPLGRERAWVETLTRWANVATQDALQPSKGQAQLDALTYRAGELDLRDFLLFSMSTYLKRVRSLKGTAERIGLVASLPESILQAIAAAYCGIDFRKAPANLPSLDYNKYFGMKHAFRLPEPGGKLDLTDLIVLVPAVLAYSLPAEDQPPALCEPSSIRPLQQKLVERLRNTSSHTIAAFRSKDAEFIEEVCDSWLNALAALAGYKCTNSQPMAVLAPTVDTFSSLIYGENISVSAAS
jgi:hypothetical protein